ncbi:MAG: hypothetical protein JNJ57_02405, partial [Saprospiraceae bacterium]|nr:hypothetical protein [Saprospiraceae bacterium]
MRWWFLFFYLTCFSGWVQATRHFSHFTEKDGLTDNQVQCILRDQQGFLWVGTSRGLNRYDGHTFKHFLPDTRQAQRTVSNENILDIRQDSFGYIWIATANGLNRYDPRTERFKVWKNTGRADGSLPNSLIWNIFIDQQQQLWLACDNRDVCRFNPQTGVFTTYPWKSFLDAVHPKSATTDYKTIYYYRPNGDTGIWFMTNFGLFSFDFESQAFDYHPYPDQGFPLAKPGGELNALFFGSWDKDLIRYEPEKRTWSRIRLPISSDLTG